MKRVLPIGIENFKEMIEGDYYYVDKTDLIRTLLMQKSKVSLFTRPRRFGKTLNMSMIRYFFELPPDGVSNRQLFEHLRIMNAGDDVLALQEQFPVISLTMKSARQPDYEMAYASLIEEISREYKRHKYILMSECLDPDVRERYEAIMYRKASAIDYAKALGFLSYCLEQYHSRKVVILIDEYDVPLEHAFYQGFYDQMTAFIRSLLESALKTNDSLAFAVLTGCLRISRESIFTGLNNLKVISILNQDYGEYYGFVEDEVRQMLIYYQRDNQMETMKRWYDGYLFGKADVYNPWSVINYVDRLLPDALAIPAAEWANTSSNEIVKDLIYQADSVIKGELESLIDGETIEKPIREEITYGDVHESQDNLWNFLLFTGYLTASAQMQIGDERYARLRIPNTEVKTIYKHQIQNWFRDEIKRRDLSVMYEAMLSGKADVFERELGSLLRMCISYQDSAESFYHGFVLGVMANLDGYMKKSNREAGSERYDVILYANDVALPPVILEFKTAKTFKELETAAQAGLQQIIDRHYTDAFIEDGYRQVMCYGLGFFRKQVRIVERTIEL